MRRVTACWAALCVLVVAGCGGGDQSTLRPESHAARAIAHLWWVMFVGAMVIFAFVCALLAIAFLRRRKQDVPQGTDGGRGSYAMVIGGGLVAPALTLAALLGLSMSTMSATSAPSRGSTQLTIEVTGHQWWWQVQYPGTDAATANELHIPVRTRVEVVARSADVIHSFWVPELNRKIDMIPGRTNTVLLEADRTGVFRGQCSEFCGLQHAHMSFLVYADTPQAFRAWLADQARPARAIAGTRGEQVFLSAPCAGCHTIRGTPATGDVGPDLTHLASRSRLAANTLANTPADLARWILEPQHVKPGNRMPDMQLGRADVQALVAYLDRLR
jgi:cytochrome c oxidase subunit II